MIIYILNVLYFNTIICWLNLISKIDICLDKVKNNINYNTDIRFLITIALLGFISYFLEADEKSIITTRYLINDLLLLSDELNMSNVYFLYIFYYYSDK